MEYSVSFYRRRNVTPFKRCKIYPMLKFWKKTCCAKFVQILVGLALKHRHFVLLRKNTARTLELWPDFRITWRRNVTAFQLCKTPTHKMYFYQETVRNFCLEIQLIFLRLQGKIRESSDKNRTVIFLKKIELCGFLWLWTELHSFVGEAIVFTNIYMNTVNFLDRINDICFSI